MIDKAAGLILTDLLMRVHDRRQQYLHTGFFSNEARLLLGNGQEDDIKFGDPDLTAAVLTISDPAYLDVIKEFFAHFHIFPTQTPMQTFVLRHVFSAAMKTKWDLSGIVVAQNKETGVRTLQIGDAPPVVYGAPILSHFTYIRLRHAIESLLVGLDDTTKHYDVPIDLNVFDEARHLKLVLDPKTYADTPLKEIIVKRRPLLLSKGRDLLTPKALVTKKDEVRPHVNVLRLWTPGGRDLCYGGYFSMPGYSILSGRLNLFLT